MKKMKKITSSNILHSSLTLENNLTWSVLEFLEGKVKDVHPYDVRKVVDFIDLCSYYCSDLHGFNIDTSGVRDFLIDCIEIGYDYSSIYNYIKQYNPESKKLLLCIMDYINRNQ